MEGKKGIAGVGGKGKDSRRALGIVVDKEGTASSTAMKISHLIFLIHPGCYEKVDAETIRKNNKWWALCRKGT